jgi:hypothetical protein
MQCRKPSPALGWNWKAGGKKHALNGVQNQPTSQQ